MLKTYKPTTPARRKKVLVSRKHLSKEKPYKKLTTGKKRFSGRGRGKISVRHKGGGHKQLFRKIDFKQDRREEKAVVKRVEYDPNRTAYIALIEYPDGEKRYILAYEGVEENHEIEVGEEVSLRPGNRTKLKNLPLGTAVHNIEIKPGSGGKLCRGAGSAAILLSKEGKYVTLKLPSKEKRLIQAEAYASIGQVSCVEHSAERLGKAGDKRYRGIRPTVRGVAMHPGAHPHGGGEGRSGIGMPTPKTVYGKKVGGIKTRKKNKYSNHLIIKRRS